VALRPAAILATGAGTALLRCHGGLRKGAFTVPMPRPAARCLVLAALLVGAGAVIVAPAATAAGGPYAERPLAEALRKLQQQGLAIVFTSRLVTPQVRVTAEPTARAPRQVLDELLAPHGLAAREDGSGVLVVVRAPPPATPDAPEPEAAPPALPVLREAIVVRPSRLPLLGAGETSTIAFEREEIERLPHLAGDLFRATSLLPGVAANDVSAQIAVRGGRRDEVKVRLDGQELYGAFHLTDYDGALSVVPARLLSGATLTTGALPASEGDRMGGLFDLRTEAAPTGRQHLLAVSVLDALAATGAGFADGAAGWRLSARRGSLAFAKRAIGAERPGFWDALGKVEATTAAGAFSAHLLATGDTLTVDHAEEEDVERLDNDYRNRYAWVRHQAGNERLLVQTVASWSQLAHDRGSATSEEKGEFVLRDRRRVRVLGLEQSWGLPGGAGSTDWGWEAQRYEAAFDYAYARDPAIVIDGPFAAPRPGTLRQRTSLRSDHGGLWARQVRAWGERLTVEAGLRYDRHEEPSEALWSPRAALAWRAAERGIVRVAWGRFAQSQRPYELAVGDGETRLHEAERSEQWVVGFETAPPTSRRSGVGVDHVRLELYHRRIANPRQRFESPLEAVNFFPEVEPGRVLLAPSESVARGAELLVRGQPSERGSWWLAYTWSRSEDLLAAEGAPREWVPRATDQPHAFTADLSRRLPRQWQVDLAWRWHTGWPTTPVTAVPPPPEEPPDDPDDPDDPEEPDDAPVAAEDDAPTMGVYGELASLRLPSYHRLDLRVSRRWESRRGTFTFFVDVQNFYNRHNVSGFDVMVDDDDMLELTGEQWPGIVPSLGIAWQLGG
jgi:TonB-dependent receptor-like protein